MTELGHDWFSGVGNKFVEIIQRRMIDGDAENQEALERAVQVAWGNAYSAETAEHEEYLRPLLRRCVSEIDGDEAHASRESNNLPLWTFMALAGVALKAASQNGDANAMKLFFVAGEVWGEIEAKFSWQTDAVRGRKTADSLKDAAEITNAAHGPLRERRFSRLRELLPKMNLESAVAVCEVEGLGSAAAIKRQWNRHRKNRDT